jgi:hypothetical protein
MLNINQMVLSYYLPSPYISYLYDYHLRGIIQLFAFIITLPFITGIIILLLNVMLICYG